MTLAIAVTEAELVIIVDALEQYETGPSADADLAGELRRDIIAKYWRKPSHSHKWSKWKPLPPDGDHGYQCETCDEIDWGK